MLCRL
jgi:hypothetical protein